MANTFNPNTLGTEAGESLWTWGQPGLHEARLQDNDDFDNDKYNDKYAKIFSNINDLKQIKTASLLLNYLLDTQKRELEHLQIIEEINNDDYLTMDLYTKKALELTTNTKNKLKMCLTCDR